MTLHRDEVRARIEAAYADLLEQDAHLLEVDANERSITHKLAEYLQHRFPDWHIDCEYNRNGDLPKKLAMTVESIHTDDAEGKTVYPDIVVHHRGSTENLLVIEAKKSTTSSSGRDADKLEAYKSEHGYRFAFAIVFPVGRAADSADVGRDILEVVS